jgi:hypothetical protein
MSPAFSSTTAHIVGLATLLLAASATLAGDSKTPAVAPAPTEPGSYSNFARALAKVDIDGDFNYDGQIDNADPGDNGPVQTTPPGLIVHTGKLTKVVLRVSPKGLAFDGEAVVTLDVRGINRGDASGEFGSPDEAAAMTGRIRVYADAGKSQLLLDSVTKPSHSWSFTQEVFNANQPNMLPRSLYIEGLKNSGQFAGDIALTATVSYAGETKKKSPFKPAQDYFLLTVGERGGSYGAK